MYSNVTTLKICKPSIPEALRCGIPLVFVLQDLTLTMYIIYAFSITESLTLVKRERVNRNGPKISTIKANNLSLTSHRTLPIYYYYRSVEQFVYPFNIIFLTAAPNLMTLYILTALSLLSRFSSKSRNATISTPIN